MAYEFRQSGVSPIDFIATGDTISMGSLPKVRGSIFHDLSVAIIEGANEKEIGELVTSKAQLIPESIRRVQATLIRRAMLGWQLKRGSWWRQHFDVISTEQSWVWPITPLIHEPLRMDKILRRKSDNALGIFDYKTMSSVTPNWIERMEISDQTHLYIQALKERSDEWVIGMCYDGVIIGKFEKGVQRSPFVTGWKKSGIVNPKWVAGSETIDLSNHPDDKWLEWIQKTGTLGELYTTTDFLNPAPDILLRTKKSIGRAEEEWYHRVGLVEEVRQKFGEQSPEFQSILGIIEKNPESCYKYGMGHACPFVSHCWQGMPMDEQFQPRVDHHQEESEGDE